MWPGASPSNLVNAAAALTIAALIIAALALARDFLIPLAFAGLFSFVLQPIVRWLDHHGFPRPAAVALVVFALLATLGLAATFLTREFTLFAADLPRYEENLRAKVRDVGAKLEGVGIWRTASGVLRRVEDEIKPPENGTGPIKVEVENKPSRPFADVVRYLQLSISPIASAGLALLFTFFILLQYQDLRDRIVRLMGTAEIGRSTQALNDAAEGLARFFRLQAGLNFTFGLFIAASLWVIGIPNAPLWGAFAAILRFVPYIGGIVSAILPLALAASVEPGWGKLAMTVALFGVAEFAIGQIIEPLLFGTKTRLSSLAVLLAAAFWTAIWGPIGLLLAMPITLALVVFAEHIPFLSLFGVLLGNEPALSPEQRLYHLLLAGDASTAAEELSKRLDEEQSLAEYLDHVAIPALSIAAADTARGILRPDQSDRLKEGVQEFIELATDIAEFKINQKNNDAPVPEGPLKKVLVLSARGEFDQATSELFTLTARLEGHIDPTCPASGGLLGINAASKDTKLDEIEYVALLSAGGATAAQLSLLIRRIKRAFPALPLGLLVGAGSKDLLLRKTEREALTLADSTKMLLDDIKATTRRGATSEPPLVPSPPFETSSSYAPHEHVRTETAEGNAAVKDAPSRAERPSQRKAKRRKPSTKPAPSSPEQ